jgi:flagellar secretion chaperone FliS
MESYQPSSPVNPYLRSQIVSASPIQLVVILHDGLIYYLHAAQEGLDIKDSQRRNEIISNNLIRAQNIVTELNASLNLEQGGVFAKELQSLYEFFLQSLVQINIHKIDGQYVSELQRVQTMITELRDAWSQVAHPNRIPEPQAA